MKTKKACIWILMTALMVSLLAGCGGKAEPDENSGLYKAVSVKALGILIITRMVFWYLWKMRFA